MPTVQIVPLPQQPAPQPEPLGPVGRDGIQYWRQENRAGQPFAVIVEWTDPDGGQGILPAEDIRERYNTWAAACGAQAIAHVTESVSIYYPQQYAGDLPIVPGPCPSAAENPFMDLTAATPARAVMEALPPYQVPCSLLADHPGRHTATVNSPDAGGDVTIVWGDVELWAQPVQVIG